MDAAHTHKWEIAEVVFGIPLLLSLALQWFLPLALPDPVPAPVRIVCGGGVALAGIWLIVLARREFARQHQPTDPGQATGKVITTGVFAYSRHPLYLGTVLVLAGISLALALPWTLASLAVSIPLCELVLIHPEEKYLTAKFGDAYRTYRAHVYKWFGHK